MIRLRRLRSSPALRRLRREVHLDPGDFILPLFVTEDPAAAGPISSMPGVERYSVAGPGLDALDREVERAAEAGLPGVLLFGIPRHKDAEGSAAWEEDGVIPRAVRRIRRVAPDLAIAADVCLCEYTEHGHCGVLADGVVDNDRTLPLLERIALVYAAAGVDLVAPSGMLDGMVAALRRALDAASFPSVGILSYAVKYASAFYGPFREAADCAPKSGDRRTHQMDPANAREAIAEAELDRAEGADVLMVKPAMPSLDVLRRLAERMPEVPLAAYQVSGEYSMIQAAAERGWIERDAAAFESLLAIKRAGADMIVTYFAKEGAEWSKTRQE